MWHVFQESCCTPHIAPYIHGMFLQISVLIFSTVYADILLVFLYITILYVIHQNSYHSWYRLTIPGIKLRSIIFPKVTLSTRHRNGFEAQWPTQRNKTWMYMKPSSISSSYYRTLKVRQKNFHFWAGQWLILLGTSLPWIRVNNEINLLIHELWSCGYKFNFSTHPFYFSYMWFFFFFLYCMSWWI